MPFILILFFLLLSNTINPQLIILSPKCKVRNFLDEYSELGDYQFIDLPAYKFHSQIFVRIEKLLPSDVSFPEISKLKSQKLKLLSPSKNFPNYPRTIYFENDEKVNPKQNTSNLKIQMVTITNKKYMVVYKAYQNIQDCLTSPLNFNGLVKTVSYKNSNLIYRLLRRKERKEIIKSLSKFQKFNHFPFCAHLHNKSILYEHFSEMQEIFPEDYNYMPKCYNLPLNTSIFIEHFFGYQPKRDDMWIIKPSTKSRGRGIRLLEKDSDIPDSGLLCKYIHNPLLVDGRKFDFRIYVLVTGFSPLKIYLYRNGLGRFAGEQYTINETNFSNNFIHLTNYAINKNSPNWEFNDSIDKEIGLKWTIFTVMENLKKKGIDVKKIWEDIKDIIIKVFISYTKEGFEDLKQFNVQSNNLFELFGLDILIDSNLRPWLMEVNMNPSLNTDSGLDMKLKSGIMTDLFNIVGIVPYNHENRKESMDYSPSYESPLQETIYETFCEFERPTGKFDRIFPLTNNIDKYKKLFQTNTIENEKLWEYMKKLNY